MVLITPILGWEKNTRLPCEGSPLEPAVMSDFPSTNKNSWWLQVSRELGWGFWFGGWFFFLHILSLLHKFGNTEYFLVFQLY